MFDEYLEQYKQYYTQEQLKVLQSKRNEIFKLVSNIFCSNLEKIDLGFSEVTVIACDQSGWPFQALFMKIGTGHTTEQFYDMVISVLQLMK